MNDVLICEMLRADAKAEWHRAKEKLETTTRIGDVSPSFITELRMKAAERERAYRRIDMICKRNGIPERE